MADSSYLRATDVAAACNVDAKTIHNWCEQRGLAHFRTPGGHLRFRPAEVAAFLAQHGFDVPAEWAAAPSTAVGGR